jgi:hypothetical protein
VYFGLKSKGCGVSNVGKIVPERESINYSLKM